MLELYRGFYNVVFKIELGHKICDFEKIEPVLLMCADSGLLEDLCYLNLLAQNGNPCSSIQCVKHALHDVEMYCSKANVRDGQRYICMVANQEQIENAFERFLKLGSSQRRSLLFLIDLAMTVTVLFQDGEITLMDFGCAYQAQVLEDHFGELANAFFSDLIVAGKIEDSIFENNAKEDLQKITKFLKNLYTIYQMRDEIYHNAMHYLDQIYIGIEKYTDSSQLKNTVTGRMESYLKYGDGLEKFCEFLPRKDEKNDMFNDTVMAVRLCVEMLQKLYGEKCLGRVADDFLEVYKNYDYIQLDSVKYESVKRMSASSKESFWADVGKIKEELNKKKSVLALIQ